MNGANVVGPRSGPRPCAGRDLVAGIDRDILGLEAVAVDGRLLLALLGQRLHERESDKRLAVLAQLLVVEVAAREVLPPGDAVLAVEVLDQVREQPACILLVVARRRIGRDAVDQRIEELLSSAPSPGPPRSGAVLHRRGAEGAALGGELGTLLLEPARSAASDRQSSRL